MSAVILRNIDKKFPTGKRQSVAAVRGVSLAIATGELMVLVGPSGSGKSTLLRLIAGLETPDTGDIFIGDHRVNEVPPAERNVAMVFQDYALFPHLTTYENMAFGLKFRRLDKAELDDRVREAAALLRLESLLERRPAALSGGQRQRVALGRAIVRRPQVFLLDEPLSNLDARLREEMRTEIARLHQTLGTTMVFVTHDQAEAMTLGDRLCVLQSRESDADGAPAGGLSATR